VADCPDLYPYELVVTWIVNDRFFHPGPVDQLALALTAALPDVEVWQRSVVRERDDRVKFRFRSADERTTGAAALAAVDPSIYVVRIVEQNPPDRVARGLP